jgi:hypothetical protein
MFHQIFCRTKIKPRIDYPDCQPGWRIWSTALKPTLVYDAFETCEAWLLSPIASCGGRLTNDRKQPTGHRSRSNGEQDDDPQKASSALA